MTRKKRSYCAHRRIPRFEPLENRELLAADMAASLDADVRLATVGDVVSISEGATAETTAPLRDKSPPRESIPEVTGEFRSIDRSGNNVLNPELGSTGQQLFRVADVGYGDGISTLAGASRPSAREINNALAAQDPDAGGNARGLSAFAYVWGQFLDHDIDLTEVDEEENLEAATISVPAGDPLFDPAGTGEAAIPFTRSEYDETTGDSPANPRQQIHSVTAWIDGSMIYGSDQPTAESLRSLSADGC